MPEALYAPLPASYQASTLVSTSSGGASITFRFGKAAEAIAWHEAVTADATCSLRGGQQGWRPISEAPQDGTPIMGCFWQPTLPHLYSPRRIYWASYHPNATGKLCWRDAPVCGNKLERLTHFKPLDLPPPYPNPQETQP